jgi:flagellar hook protein FlgE
MGTFAIPLSGLSAAQTQLQYISNNLANMNTTGYKDQNVSFSDLFASAYSITTNGSGDPIQNGSGVKVSATDQDFTEGNLNATGQAANMALSGNGFFIVRDGSGNQAYTRAGDFTTNNGGQLITPSGSLLLGYPALNGVVNTSATLQPIEVGSLTSPAQASQNFSITANMNASSAVGESAPPSTFSVYDSLGVKHDLSVAYTKTGINTWSYNVSMPASDFTAGGTGSTVVASGTLNFKSDGSLDTTAGNTLNVPIPGLNDGASNLNLTWKLTDAAGNGLVTQTATASATSATSQDGYASGTLTSYTVQADGTIAGSFSSGKTLALGQVAVASFANVQGLQSTGNNNYSSTPASGAPVVGTAETGGRGSILGGSVEQSNVDISKEFAKLIAAQQAYSAYAKSITAFNQVSQATIAMIQ